MRSGGERSQELFVRDYQDVYRRLGGLSPCGCPTGKFSRSASTSDACFPAAAAAARLAARLLFGHLALVVISVRVFCCFLLFAF